MTVCVDKLGIEPNRKRLLVSNMVYVRQRGDMAQTVRGGRGAGFGMAVGQQGGAASRIAPHLPGFILVRG